MFAPGTGVRRVVTTAQQRDLLLNTVLGRIGGAGDERNVHPLKTHLEHRLIKYWVTERGPHEGVDGGAPARLVRFAQHRLELDEAWGYPTEGDRRTAQQAPGREAIVDGIDTLTVTLAAAD